MSDVASRTRIVLVDDLTEVEIPEGEGQTVSFSVGSATYEIDLSDSNLGKLYDALQPFTNKARRVGRGSRARSRREASESTTAAKERVGKEQLQAMRQWAQENGYKVSNRGRISKEVQDAYHAAH